MNYCTECGTEVEGSENYCPECGSKINESATVEESTQKKGEEGDDEDVPWKTHGYVSNTKEERDGDEKWYSDETAPFLSWFGGASLEDMKNKPRLRDGEDTIVVALGQLGDVVRKNAVVAVTTERIIVRPKRGRSVPDEESGRGSMTVDFDEVDKVRTYGMFTKDIVVVCGDETHELPPLPNKSGEVLDAIVERAGLEATEWGDNIATRGTKALVATVGGGLGLLVGIIGVLIGIGMIFTLVGILFGVFLALGSALLTKASWSLLSWGYNKKEEYSAPPSA